MPQLAAGLLMHRLSDQGPEVLPVHLRSMVTSNMILIEWPPKTGKTREIPEVDRAAFFTLEQARTKLCAYLKPAIELLEKPFDSR